MEYKQWTNYSNIKQRREVAVMNILNECTKNDVELIEKAGVIIEDKDYNQEELKRCKMQR